MIEKLREEIDKLDNEIIKLLDQRFDCTHKIGEEKKALKANVLDSSREQKILDKIDALSSSEHSEYIKEIYKKIMEQSRNEQGK